MTALAIADDALIAAQRLLAWVSRAPTMEEDVALANIALDQLGVARALLSSLGDEDELAFHREAHEFRNCLLVELPDDPGGSVWGDFGVLTAKLLFLAAYQKMLYDRLADSEPGALGAVAAKARKESAYHLDHATQWTLRLGDGTAESHGRMQDAVDALWPYTHELTGLIERADWLAIVEPVLAKATLARPADGWQPTGGRVGRHTEHLSYLLAEMQSTHRAHPGATW
ncbi:1,2-phenylacetyl-CoA epoxidase subunit PaaC [Luedemannella helvata]|uniref:Phenylacetate-CoA oxygenase subunit PaaC n=1 Tax=Luedemannella helvata TaxID=349315 RepID=A0ABN2JSD0_9ACTN